jgi:hypothetical protein
VNLQHTSPQELQTLSHLLLPTFFPKEEFKKPFHADVRVESRGYNPTVFPRGFSESGFFLLNRIGFSSFFFFLSSPPPTLQQGRKSRAIFFSSRWGEEEEEGLQQPVFFKTWYTGRERLSFSRNVTIVDYFCFPFPRKEKG